MNRYSCLIHLTSEQCRISPKNCIPVVTDTDSERFVRLANSDKGNNAEQHELTFKFGTANLHPTYIECSCGAKFNVAQE